MNVTDAPGAMRALLAVGVELDGQVFTGGILHQAELPEEDALI